MCMSMSGIRELMSNVHTLPIEKGGMASDGHWDIMKLASTWCVLDPERVCSELNELFFLNFT